MPLTGEIFHGLLEFYFSFVFMNPRPHCFSHTIAVYIFIQCL